MPLCQHVTMKRIRIVGPRALYKCKECGFETFAAIKTGYSTEEVGVLTQLGLTEYEAEAYLTLLRIGPLGVAELAFHSIVPRTKVYGAMKSLASKGFVGLSSNSPLCYAAFSPQITLMPIIQALDERVKLAKQLVRKLLMQIASCEASFATVGTGLREGKPNSAPLLMAAD